MQIAGLVYGAAEKKSLNLVAFKETMTGKGKMYTYSNRATGAYAAYWPSLDQYSGRDAAGLPLFNEAKQTYNQLANLYAAQQQAVKAKLAAKK